MIAAIRTGTVIDFNARPSEKTKEHSMPTLMSRFLKNRAGTVAIEYALIGILVSIAIISAAALVAGNML